MDHNSSKATKLDNISARWFKDAADLIPCCVAHVNTISLEQITWNFLKLVHYTKRVIGQIWEIINLPPVWLLLLNSWRRCEVKEFLVSKLSFWIQYIYAHIYVYMFMSFFVRHSYCLDLLMAKAKKSFLYLNVAGLLNYTRKVLHNMLSLLRLDAIRQPFYTS